MTPAIGAPDEDPAYGVVVLLAEVMADRGMTMGELARQTDINIKNLREFRDNKRRAVWWSTLAAICKALDCQPGDLIAYRPS